MASLQAQMLKAYHKGQYKPLETRQPIPHKHPVIKRVSLMVLDSLILDTATFDIIAHRWTR